jgi:DNA polymerase-4
VDKERKWERVVFHADMDSFFASVEVATRPELRGKPVIVGGRPDGRSVVSSPSYEARKFGVHSAMPTAEAKRLCPHGIFLPVDGKKYGDYSKRIHQLLIEFTPEVEPFSIDEAFLELPFSWRQREEIRQAGESIRGTIRKRFNLAATIGAGPNKMIAKLASKAGKPDGFKIIPPEKVDEFLLYLPVGKLWGVGERTRASLHRLGLYQVSDIRRLPMERLNRLFGSWGQSLYNMAWGIDDSPLHPWYEDHDAKSVGHEETFGKDISDPERILAHLMELSERVAMRLRRKNYQAGLITVKRKLPSMKLQTRAQMLAWPTQLEKDIFDAAKKALCKFPKPYQAIRLLGVSAGKIVTEENDREPLLMQPLLEGEQELTKTMDRMRAKYGKEIIHRARSRLTDPEK